MLFSCASAFVFVQQLHQHCIARCFPIHLPGMFLVNIFYLIWRCQNWKKTQIIDFYLKTYWKMLFLGAQKGYTLWARSPPQIKRRPPPPISKPHPATKSFSTILFSCASALFFLQQLHQHCIAWSFLIHLPMMFLVHMFNFMDYSHVFYCIISNHIILNNIKLI